MTRQTDTPRTLLVECPGCDGNGVEPNTHGRRVCGICGGDRAVKADPIDEVCPTCKAIPGMNCRGTGAREVNGVGVHTHASRVRKVTRRAKRYMKENRNHA